MFTAYRCWLCWRRHQAEAHVAKCQNLLGATNGHAFGALPKRRSCQENGRFRAVTSLPVTTEIGRKAAEGTKQRALRDVVPLCYAASRIGTRELVAHCSQHTARP